MDSVRMSDGITRWVLLLCIFLIILEDVLQLSTMTHRTDLDLSSTTDGQSPKQFSRTKQNRHH